MKEMGEIVDPVASESDDFPLTGDDTDGDHLPLERTAARDARCARARLRGQLLATRQRRQQQTQSPTVAQSCSLIMLLALRTFLNAQECRPILSVEAQATLDMQLVKRAQVGDVAELERSRSPRP